MKRILLLALAAGMVGCMTKPISPKPDYGAETCGVIPGTTPNKKGELAQFCHYKACDVSKGTHFYFHGFKETHRAAMEANVLIRGSGHPEFKRMAKDRCMDLVIMSGGDNWMIRTPNHGAAGKSSQYSPTFDEVRNKWIPYIETNLKIQRPYVAAGQSQGGYNLATMILNDPTLFSRAIITHPVMSTRDEFILADVLVGFHFTLKEWQLANPVQVIKQSRITSLPPMLITGCEADEFGIWKGPNSFHSTAVSKGFNSTFLAEPEGCKHTSIMEQPLLDWLDKPMNQAVADK